jgi:hypothetical protein
MSAKKTSYAGLDLAELLQLEIELCTPLKRADWFNRANGGSPHAIRAAMLNGIFDDCARKGLRHQSELVSALPRNYTPGQIYQYFKAGTFHDDDATVWDVSRDILRTMLVGTKNTRGLPKKRAEVAENIVHFFFPVSDGSSFRLPPPFFQVERTNSEAFRAWPHDEVESAFFAVSLAKKYCENGKRRLRWFMASGGGLFRELTDEREFYRWAERLTAALCFGLEFTFLIPERGKEGNTHFHGFVDRLNEYWDSLDHKLDKTSFRDRYPGLDGLVDPDQIANRARASVKTVTVPMNGETKNVTEVGLRQMFPVQYRLELGNPEVYGATFLNPWLRFHWVDLSEHVTRECTAKFASIAFNDGSGRNRLVLLTPESMTEYLKWLTAYANSDVNG